VAKDLGASRERIGNDGRAIWSGATQILSASGQFNFMTKSQTALVFTLTVIGLALLVCAALMAFELLYPY